MTHVQIAASDWDRIFGSNNGNGSTVTATATKPKRSTKAKPKRSRKRKQDRQQPRRLPESKPADSLPEPGVYTGVSFDEYLAWPFVNNTLLSHAAKSMAHFHAAENSVDESSTAAQQLGQLLHTGKLELSALAETHVIMPRFEDQVLKEDGSRYSTPKATKQYKELVAAFEAANVGKVIVTQDDYDRLSAMLQSLSESERAVEYLHHDGPAEISIVWDDPETGIRCKARIDKVDLQRNRIVDLKSACDVGDFGRAIFNYSYHRQLAFYSFGIETLTGRRHEACIVAVESSQPFGVRAAPMASEAIEAGRNEYRRLLNQISICRQTGDYPGYEDPDEWDLPEWSKPKSEPVTLNIDGKQVTV